VNALKAAIPRRQGQLEDSALSHGARSGRRAVLEQDEELLRPLEAELARRESRRAGASDELALLEDILADPEALGVALRDPAVTFVSADLDEFVRTFERWRRARTLAASGGLNPLRTEGFSDTSR
jgi:hypothetical protein